MLMNIFPCDTEKDTPKSTQLVTFHVKHESFESIINLGHAINPRQSLVEGAVMSIYPREVTIPIGLCRQAYFVRAAVMNATEKARLKVELFSKVEVVFIGTETTVYCQLFLMSSKQMEVERLV